MQREQPEILKYVLTVTEFSQSEKRDIYATAKQYYRQERSPFYINELALKQIEQNPLLFKHTIALTLTIDDVEKLNEEKITYQLSKLTRIPIQSLKIVYVIKNSNIIHLEIIDLSADIFCSKQVRAELVQMNVILVQFGKPDDPFEGFLKTTKNDIVPLTLLIASQPKQEMEVQTTKLSEIRQKANPLQILSFKNEADKFTLATLGDVFLEKDSEFREFAEFFTRFARPKNRWLKPLQNKIILSPPSKELDQAKFSSDWHRYDCLPSQEFQKDWPEVFYGTSFSNALAMCYFGFNPETIENNYIPESVNSHGKGIYFSPSLEYETFPCFAHIRKMSKKSGKHSGNHVQIVLICRLNPKCYKVFPQTIQKINIRIDPNYKNSELEWMIPTSDPQSFKSLNENIMISGFMIRETKAAPNEKWWDLTNFPKHLVEKWYEDEDEIEDRLRISEFAKENYKKCESPIFIEKDNIKLQKYENPRKFCQLLWRWTKTSKPLIKKISLRISLK